MLCNITPRSNFTLFLSIFLTINWAISSILLHLLFMLSLVILGQLSPTEVQFSSLAQSCTTLCDPMDCGTPGFPVHHQLLEHTQTHAHQVGDIIQTSYPLWSPSPPTFNLSQHQGLFFQGVSSSHQVAKASASASVLPMNIQDWFPLGLTGLISLQFKGLSRIFSPTPQFKSILGAQLSLWSKSHIHIWLLERP